MISGIFVSPAAIATSPNPFPGLRPFEYHESHLFFGREGQSERLIEKLSRTRFLAVVGASGSGKSSLVRAGLLPELLGGMMPGAGSAWRVSVMRPGNDPIGHLARALNSRDAFGAEDEENRRLQIAITAATLRRGNLGLVEAVRQTGMTAPENLLVIADQFEELFRVGRNRRNEAASDDQANDKAAFVKLLLEAARQREVNIYVVLTMRSDYLGDCAQFQGLPEAINEGQYLIPRLTRQQLREAITGPVAVGKAAITPRLVNRLLNDVGDNPDQLPILQHALMRTWNEWKKKTPEHAARHQGEALDLCCYETIGGMSEALSRHADEAYTEVGQEMGARGQQIAATMFRLLTEKGADNREIRRPVTLNEICAVAKASEAEVSAVIEKFRAPDRSFLMPPAEVKLNADSLIDISHESLIRGWAQLKKWVDEEAESGDNWYRLADTAARYEQKKAGLLTDLDLETFLKWREEKQPNAAWAQRYHPDPENFDFGKVMGFLEDSRKKHEDEEMEKRSQRRRERQRKLLLAFALVIATAFLISLISAVYAWQQWNKAEKQRQLADDATQSALKQEDIANRKTQEAKDAVGKAEEQAKMAEKQKQAADIARQQADEQRLIAETERKKAAAEAMNNRQSLYVADMNLAQEKIEDENSAKASERLSVHLADDDLREFAWGYLWRLSHNELAELKGHTATVRAVAFSREMLATGSDDQTVKLWDTQTNRVLATLKGHTAAVWSVAFSPDGRTLATGSRDQTVKLWSTRMRQELATLKGHTSYVWSVAFSPDGKTLASGSEDKTMRLWQAATDEEVARQRNK